MYNELQNLENLAINSMYTPDIYYYAIKHSVKIAERFFNRGSVLELGPAEGKMTELLLNKFNDLTVIEASKTFCNNIQNSFPSVKVANILFENYSTDIKYDNIVISHVLEHVIDPIKLLKQAKTWLKDNGKIFIAVPNANSIHRQLGTLAGLMLKENEITENDLVIGHRRVYDPSGLRYDVMKAGLTIEHYGGYWLKPLSNKQIQETWSENIIEASIKLGERYPDIAAEIYVIATK